MKEVLVSGHLAPLSGLPSYYRIHHSCALRYAYLCVLIDQDSANVFRLNMLWLDRAQLLLERRLDEITFNQNNTIFATQALAWF